MSPTKARAAALASRTFAAAAAVAKLVTGESPQPTELPDVPAAAPAAKQAKAPAKKVTPAAKVAVTAAKKVTPAAKKAVTAAKKATPTAKKAATAAAKVAPAAKVTPAATKAVTAAKKVTPAATRAATAAKKVTPTATKAATAAKKVPPAKTVAPAAKQAVTRPAAATRGRGATTAAATRRSAKATAVLPKRLESPWTAAELQGFRDSLETDIASFKEEIQIAEHEIVALMRHSGDGAGDDQADAGAKTFEREQEMSLANNAREMLIQSLHAIERLDLGNYGICESCGEPIGKPRLEAAPRATLCLSCKSKQERR